MENPAFAGFHDHSIMVAGTRNQRRYLHLAWDIAPLGPTPLRIILWRSRTKSTMSAAGNQLAATKETATAPISIRLTEDERTRLERNAQGLGLSAYVRKRLFGEPDARKSPVRIPTSSARQFAHILAALGQSDISANLRELLPLPEPDHCPSLKKPTKPFCPPVTLSSGCEPTFFRHLVFAKVQTNDLERKSARWRKTTSPSPDLPASDANDGDVCRCPTHRL